MADAETELDWKEALESAVDSHRKNELSEWELHLIGRRVEAALDKARADGGKYGWQPDVGAVAGLSSTNETTR